MKGASARGSLGSRPDREMLGEEPMAWGSLAQRDGGGEAESRVGSGRHGDT